MDTDGAGTDRANWLVAIFHGDHCGRNKICASEPGEMYAGYEPSKFVSLPASISGNYCIRVSVVVGL